MQDHHAQPDHKRPSLCLRYDELPDTEVCRDQRRINRIINGRFFRDCARCGRDLGPNPHPIVVESGWVKASAEAAARKPKNGPRKRHLSFMNSTAVPLSSKKGSLPSDTQNPGSVSARKGAERGGQVKEGRATGKDAPRPVGRPRTRPVTPTLEKRAPANKEKTCPNCGGVYHRKSKYCKPCENCQGDAAKLADVKRRRRDGTIRRGRPAGYRPVRRAA